MQLCKVSLGFCMRFFGINMLHVIWSEINPQFLQHGDLLNANFPKPLCASSLGQLWQVFGRSQLSRDVLLELVVGCALPY